MPVLGECCAISMLESEFNDNLSRYGLNSFEVIPKIHKVFSKKEDLELRSIISRHHSAFFSLFTLYCLSNLA